MTTIDLTISITTQQKNQLTALQEKLRTHLRKIWLIYVAATDAQKAELRAHNWVLALLADIVGQ